MFDQKAVDGAQVQYREGKARSVLRNTLPVVGLDGLAEDSRTALQYGL